MIVYRITESVLHALFDYQEGYGINLQLQQRYPKVAPNVLLRSWFYVADFHG